MQKKENLKILEAHQVPMKGVEIEAIRQIALLGGHRDFVSLSSAELGEALGLSQQSASRRILDLIERGLVQRELSAKKQRLRLTDKGLDALRKEFSLYRKIFEPRDTLIICGTVTTGLGEGKYYVTQGGYRKQFVDRLGFNPYNGTLNLKLTVCEMEKLKTLKGMDGILIQGFKSQGRTFGDVKCFPATIKNMDCAVVIPMRSHHSEVVELISKYHLRTSLGLEDGDSAEVYVRL